MDIWKTARSARGTLAETYLRTRGIVIPMPDVLRFHPQLRHPTDEVWPAMIALVEQVASAFGAAILRTYLARDGHGKAPVEPSKMMLGRCSGGAVRLAPASDCLLVGEGIETCLSAMQETGLPAWAALSTSGLKALDLPTAVKEVIVLADGDDPGESAAICAAMRWTREGRVVRIARPPPGSDFNDLLDECR